MYQAGNREKGLGSRSCMAMGNMNMHAQEATLSQTEGKGKDEQFIFLCDSHTRKGS